MPIKHTPINEQAYLAEPIEVEHMKIGVAWPEDGDHEPIGEGHVLLTIVHDGEDLRLVLPLDMAQALLDRLPDAIAMAKERSALLT